MSLLKPAFKVIKTIEGNDVMLSVVPSSWENNGVLFWPSGVKSDKIRKDPSSVPSANWTRHACFVLKKDIVSYSKAIEYQKKFEQTATEDEQNIANEGDSESEEEREIHKSKRSRTHEMSFSDYTPLVEAANNPEKAVLGTSMNIDSIGMCCCDGSKFDSLKREVQNNTTVSKERLTVEKERLAIEKANGIKLDRILDLISKGSTSTIGNGENTTSKMYTVMDVFDAESEGLPIVAVEGIREFDKKLQNPEFKEKFIKYCQSYAGTSGCADWKIAFSLVDLIFDRQVLIHFSWTGVAKGNNSKIAFNQFKEIIQSFSLIMKRANNNFSMKDTEKFFKQKILKHAFSRAHRRLEVNPDRNSDEATEPPAFDLPPVHL
ncbi:uncharacterized protein LOC129792434 [Lutzomyia longipalpis]|uniref:DUF4806 domain-containing protein n=1 Tax=Lutzomyia longipalpis TaxID=7200 RepID=A0A1B0CFA3_LUTLO|nr:uncharacterized protein LOC129792434 [Lutzomyia longipalpis]